MEENSEYYSKYKPLHKLDKRKLSSQEKSVKPESPITSSKIKKINKSEEIPKVQEEKYITTLPMEQRMKRVMDFIKGNKQA